MPPATTSAAAPTPRRAPEWRLHPFWERTLVVIFFATLALPGVATLAGVDAGVTRGENRDLAPAPTMALTWPAITGFPAAFTAYFQDHFAFRGRLVRWQAALRLLVLQVSPSPTVWRGRDGWLFYADDGALEDAVNQSPLTPADLALWATTLQHTRDWLAARHITYLFVIAPDKHQVYPEYLPAGIRKASDTSRTDQLVAYLRAHTNVPVLDLRATILDAKRDARVYHRTDSHWNDLGAAAAARQIFGHLYALSGGALPGLAPSPDSAYTRTDVRAPGRDLARMLGLEAWVSEDEPRLRPAAATARVIEPAAPDPNFDEARLVTTSTRADLPRAVVYRDSFGSALVPFLAEHFSRAVYLWEYDVNPELVEQEHPQVVIQEWAGRRFSTRLPYDPFAAAGPPAASASSPIAPVSSSEPARR